jgi:saccharopine dehydrogenase-like NADP-dependent oxidoreductase
MKVIVLGSGGMGCYAAATVARFDWVDELVVADLDVAAASACASLHGAKARAASIDVRDAGALTRLFSGAGAVLNTVGPFFRLGPPVLRAAIAAGVHYFDINDDWESTEAMLALDSEARAAGITAVIGMGASPGISNLLACLAMRELDSVDEVIAGFDLDAAMPEQRRPQPAAATVHGLHQLTGRIRVFEDGRFANARPMRRVDFDYPGLGRRAAWTMGHPEAVTFPRHYPKLRSARVVMTMAPVNRIAVRVVGALIDAGLVSLERAAAWVEWLEGVGGPVKTPADYVREIADDRGRRLPPLFAIARGRHGEQHAAVGAAIRSAPAVGMGGATGVPLATVFGVVHPDAGTLRGVFPPEAIVDPTAFFDALAPLCTPVCSGVADLVILTRSWQSIDLAEELRRSGGGTPRGVPDASARATAC